MSQENFSYFLGGVILGFGVSLIVMTVIGKLLIAYSHAEGWRQYEAKRHHEDDDDNWWKKGSEQLF